MRGCGDLPRRPKGYACATSGPDAYVLWYLLALTLAPLAPDLAVDAFLHGAHGDFRARESPFMSIQSGPTFLNLLRAAKLQT